MPRKVTTGFVGYIGREECAVLDRGQTYMRAVFGDRSGPLCWQMLFGTQFAQFANAECEHRACKEDIGVCDQKAC